MARSGTHLHHYKLPTVSVLVKTHTHTHKNHFHRQNCIVIIGNYNVLITARKLDKKEWAAITVRFEYRKLLGGALENILIEDREKKEKNLKCVCTGLNWLRIGF